MSVPKKGPSQFISRQLLGQFSYTKTPSNLEMLDSGFVNSFKKPYSCPKLAPAETQYFPVTTECHKT